MGRALGERDLEAIANSWEVPALVLSDEGAVAVADAGEIERFFAQAVDWYRGRGVMTARPEIERLERLTPRLYAVDVRWPGFDATGRETWSERSHYILRLDDDGRPRVRVALTLAPQGSA
jgi:hypothetical protein